MGCEVGTNLIVCTCRTNVATDVHETTSIHFYVVEGKVCKSSVTFES